jgi:hypothetical protein
VRDAPSDWALKPLGGPKVQPISTQMRASRLVGPSLSLLYLMVTSCGAPRCPQGTTLMGEYCRASRAQPPKVDAQGGAGGSVVAVSGVGGTTSGAPDGATAGSAGASSPPAVSGGASAPSQPVAPGTPTAGASCTQPGQKACGGRGSALILTCVGTGWSITANCGATQRCDPNPGPSFATCASAVSECIQSQAGGRVCLGGTVQQCDDDLLRTQLLEQCTGTDLPDCQNGHCVCLTRCDGMCRSLQNDPDHCGTCDHSCHGSLCQDGVCRPSVVTTSPSLLRSIVIDARSNALYWIDPDGSRVLRVLLDGGGAPEITISASLQPQELLGMCPS